MSVLERPVLVLNRSWQPVNVCLVARALTMLCAGTAQAIDEHYQLHEWDSWLEMDPEPHPVRSQHFSIRAPSEVITASQFIPEATVTYSRRNVFKRDRYTCQYCHRQPPVEDLTLDHVVPLSQGGRSSFENCVLACLECNRIKANRTPEEAGMKLKRAPKRPEFTPQYALHIQDMPSWRRFISDAYWDAELE